VWLNGPKLSSAKSKVDSQTRLNKDEMEYLPVLAYPEDL